jgi:hypothetical protein
MPIDSHNPADRLTGARDPPDAQTGRHPLRVGVA